MATQRFSSASHSNMGNSTTHSGRQPGSTELQIVADLQAQRAEGVVDDPGRVGAEENQVVVGGAGALENALERRIAQELDDRGLQPSRPWARSFTLMYASPRAP